MRNERRRTSERTCALGVALACAVAACSGQVRDEPAADGGVVDGGLDAGGDAGLDAGVDERACATQDDCALVAATCCGVCGEPAANDMTSVRWDRTEAYRRAVCGPGPVPCPLCAVRTNPHLATACRAGQCAAVDVRADDALAGCAADADCTLRYGTACCEVCAGAPEDLTAIAKRAIADAVRCAPNEGACPPCVPVYPRTARARCNPSTKRCEVAITR